MENAPRQISVPALDAEAQVFNPYRQFTGIFIPEGLCRRSDISPTSKLIYGRLARFAGADGWCYPAVATLATEVGIKKRQARRCLEELEAAGLIRRDFQPGHSTRYRFVGQDQLASGKGPRSETTAPVDPVRSQTTVGAVTNDRTVRSQMTAKESQQESPGRESTTTKRPPDGQSASEDVAVDDLRSARDLLFWAAAAL